MRGRLGSGILRTMDLGELVAADRPGYVDIAVRLASSPEYRTAIRRQIEEGRHVLWEDSGTVEALAQILDSGAPLPRQT
jgi:predicted O-linked N-acetylglucosamine transferase (SPINDLY family)